MNSSPNLDTDRGWQVLTQKTERLLIRKNLLKSFRRLWTFHTLMIQEADVGIRRKRAWRKD